MLDMTLARRYIAARPSRRFTHTPLDIVARQLQDFNTRFLSRHAIYYRHRLWPVALRRCRLREKVTGRPPLLRRWLAATMPPLRDAHDYAS